MKAFAVLGAGIGALLAGLAHAGESTMGQISGVHFMGNGAVIFYHSGQRSGAPACATIPNRFAIEGSTSTGKVQVAGLLSAVARGKNIYVLGLGVCNAWSDTETVNYFSVAD